MDKYEIDMNKLGLVFAGGGGKGSYEIGVWKYLRQIGLDKYVSVVSGASVGALNATLFINGNLELAEQIWRESIAGEIVKIYSRKKILKAVIQPDTYGLSSRKGLIDIIDNKLSLETISKSSIKTYVTLTELPHITDNHFIQAIEARQRKYKPTYMLLNGETPKTIKEMLLASSAIPGVFAAERLKDKFYYDGGLKDNVPIKPLYDEGCSHVIVVYLDRKSSGVISQRSRIVAF